MRRLFLRELEQWESTGTREPLMVIGARQVGKTWLLKEFCENTYEDYIYINLEERQDCHSAFDGNLDPDTILRTLEIILGRRIRRDKCVIFFDEIQTCERAITSLKYFCEAKENYRILCAGSLLGVKLQRFENSFPVGKVKICKMYPFDFEEFLLACGEELLRDSILEAAENYTPLPEGIHQRALSLYHDYLFTGGMPRIIRDYLEHDKNCLEIDQDLYQGLRFAYLADMNKYVISPAESVKIAAVYQSVPRQLAKDNPKFMYKEVKTGANKRDYRGPVDWLTASGLVYAIHKLESPQAPIKGYEDDSSYKLYLSDVGLLTNLCGLHYRDMLSETHNLYKGSVVENYVIQQLVSQGKELYYFKPSESMEIDLLWDDGSRIVPAEIKSGRHKRSTSLKNYQKKYEPAFALRFSELNFGQNDRLRSLPLYAAFCLRY